MGEDFRDDVHEVYAIRYVHHARRSPENFIGGDPLDVLQPLDYFVWAIVGRPARSWSIAASTRRWRAAGGVRSSSRCATGSPRSASRRTRSLMSSSVTCTTTIAAITTCCRRPVYHLQDREMAFATGRCMCHATLRIPFEADDVVAMVRKVFAGRAAFHDGNDEIVPGMSVHLIGGHSKGLQCVRVKTRRGHVVLASDATHLYAHMDSGRVFPITYNVGEVIEGYGTLKKLATSPRHVVPGHDPLVLVRYPAAKPGLEGWIARLDVEPKG
jgi:hypothetical protein